MENKELIKLANRNNELKLQIEVLSQLHDSPDLKLSLGLNDGYRYTPILKLDGISDELALAIIKELENEIAMNDADIKGIVEKGEK